MSRRQSADNLLPSKVDAVEDGAITTQTAAARRTDPADTDDHARSGVSSAAEEVARELVSFLSQLSPFRIRSYPDDH
jgi:hypothetical protein